VLRPAGFISLQFSNSRRASFCRMLMETRDSLLLIVRWPAVRASFGSLVVSGWTRPPAERDVEILVMNHVVVTLAWAASDPFVSSHPPPSFECSPAPFDLAQAVTTMYNHHGQTLYTPAFPSGENPLAKSLSHLHLTLASLPAELAPPSRPSSPGFNSRRQAVYDNVRAAYNAVGGQTSHGGWTQVYRLVDMTCTRSRFKKPTTRIERTDPEEGVPWILAETEEEWAEWEKAREKAKSRLRRTDTEIVEQRGHPSTSGTSSKRVNLRDKVTSWKAQVDRSFHEDEDIVHEPKSSNPATARSSQPSSAKKRVSPINFPVIKPSTLQASNDAKAKGKVKQRPSRPVPKPDPPPHTDLEGPRSPAVKTRPAATSNSSRKPPSEREEATPKPVS